MSLCTYAYISKATEDFSDQELMKILEASRTNNPKDDITGMLLYAGGKFMQIIEGDEAQLDRLVTRIKQDPRHHHFYTLEKTLSTRRHFEEWSMSFKRTDPSLLSQAIPGFNGYVEDPGNPQARRKLSNFGMQALVNTFRKVIGDSF